MEAAWRPHPLPCLPPPPPRRAHDQAEIAWCSPFWLIGSKSCRADHNAIRTQAKQILQKKKRFQIEVGAPSATNPKPEIRNPKQTRNPKSELLKQRRACFEFG